MAQIDTRLALNLGLKIFDDVVEEKFRQETETAVAQVVEELAKKDMEIAALKEEILSKNVEQDLYKKMYEKALEMLTEKKLSSDVPKVAQEPAKESPKKEPPEEEPKLVDLNNCAAIDLVNIGFDNRVAKMIISNRPYHDVDELRFVNGITKIGFKIARPKLTVGEWIVPKKEEQESPKVNINTATWQELRDRGGISEKTAKNVIAYRNEHGKFLSLEDLLNVSRFGKVCLVNSRDKLTV